MKQYLSCVILIVTILMLAASCRKPSSLYEELKADDKLEAAYHFNPSTLRMLNFQNDSSINKLVKGVRKMSLLSMKSSAMNDTELRAYAEEFQSSGEYELYLELEGPEMQCYILGDEASAKTVALYAQEERCYVVDIYGKVNFMELPKAFRSLSERDSTAMDGFSLLFETMQTDAENERRRREWRAKRAAEKAEKEMKPDSLSGVERVDKGG